MPRPRLSRKTQTRSSKNAHGISIRQSDQLNRRVLGSRPDGAHNLVILGIPAGGGDVGMPPSPESEVAKVAHREEAAWRGSAHERERKANALVDGLIDGTGGKIG